MSLTDTQCKGFKAQSKSYKKSDGQGLYLLITPAEQKYWRMNYRFADKSKTLALGVYPYISLKEAREKRDEAKKQLREGLDPSFEKKKTKIALKMSNSSDFESIVHEWFDMRREGFSKNYEKQIESLMRRDIFPFIGKRPIMDITAQELLIVLRQIESRGALDMAHRARQCCGQIFRYAIAIGKAERDPTQDLKGALKTRKVINHKYLTEAQLPAFFEKLSRYEGEKLTALALRFIILTFVRTTELRDMPWEGELDREQELWRIPKERMKNGMPHIVPLSRQAINTLEDIHKITAKWDYVFPNSVNPHKCMSENTMLFAMYRMGYHSRATVHGFRATASTILYEHGFTSEIVERQLAHVERNKVKAAYNHAEYLKERRAMMQWWADHLETMMPEV